METYEAKAKKIAPDSLRGFATCPEPKLIADLVGADCWVKPTGSRVTEYYTDESDYDYVVFNKNGVAMDILLNRGAVMGGSNRPESTFASLRFGLVNIILVDKKEEFLKWQQATELIRVVNPKTKEERIRLFDMVFERDKKMEGVLF